jgi:hypothetical protein
VLHLRPSELRRYAATAPSLPVNQDRAEVRLLATLLTAGFALFLFEPIFYLLAVPSAPISRVARLAPSHWYVVAAFAACLLATLPHLFDLCFRSQRLGNPCPRRRAALASIGAAVTWLYLAVLAYPLDMGLVVPLAYGMRASGSLVLGLAYGISINAQQLRSLLHVKDR